MRKLLAVVLAAVVATPAFAAVQNVKVSGDIDSTYLSRQQFNLGAKDGSAIPTGLEDQSIFLTQTRLRVDADLSDNVSTTVGLINERAWGQEESSNDTDIQLYLAYATLRELLYSPLTVTIGRQVFAYGNGLVIGDGGQNNDATDNLASIAADLTKRSTYDGIKAVLDYKPLTVDLFYFKNNTGTTDNTTGALSNARDDYDVYGINTNYQLGDEMNTVAEGYLFVAKDNNNFNQSDKGDIAYVPGLRVSTNPVKGLNTQAEVAWQLGTKTVSATTPANGGTNTNREAMAAQFLASYEVPALEEYKPVVSGSYTFVSGDKNRSATRHGSFPGGQNSGEDYSAWDPLFESQGAGTIYNTLFDLTNLHIYSAGIKVNPLEDLTAKFSWTGLRLHKQITALNALTFQQPDGQSVSPATSSSKSLGNEYDVNLSYAYTEDVSFGLNLGWFVPGNTFTGANDSTASQAIANVIVNF